MSNFKKIWDAKAYLVTVKDSEAAELGHAL